MYLQYQNYLYSYSCNETDKQHSDQLLKLFKQQVYMQDDTLVVDCHNYTRKDIIWLLDFLFSHYKGKIKYITGVGNNSKKPIMDYYLSTLWKNPMFKFVRDYYTQKNKGATLKTGHGYINVTH